MSFEEFKAKILPIAKAAEDNVVFSKRGGQHVAEFSSGCIITSNAYSSRISVNWGSTLKHRSFAKI